MKTDAGLSGSVPQMNHGAEGVGSKALFHSVRDIALIIDKTIQGGFGVLKAGTILAENDVSGLCIPYIGTAISDTENVGRSYVVADVANGTTCNVTLEDSYKFQVGDNLMLVHSDGASPPDVAYHAGGAIISIDRTTYASYAVITFTTTTGGAGFTTATFTQAYTAGGTTTRFSTAKYILDQDIDTGSGENTVANGANTSIVISNAVLYTASLVNLDAAAISALGVEDGRLFILK